MAFSCGARSASSLIEKTTWEARYRAVSCKAFVRQAALESPKPEKAFDRNIFVNGFPMNSHAPANETPFISLRRRRH
jgi:hypothetical protein